MTIQLPVSTIENVVNDVAKQIAKQSSAYLKFPSVQEQDEIASAFSEEFNFLFSEQSLQIEVCFEEVKCELNSTIQEKRTETGGFTRITTNKTFDNMHNE